ncbi:F-box/WD repeat-containing protein 12-like [Ochotona curzoniae]|uniref:F-box/WD repeat-containing protein 12-like n=1 Tax=Ochotona curzoniae TaxID=130825 RepID=UPI001B350DA3|nr:F-box/WD repeat-containing protein 12-like [Ochotona curzoniae]
MHVGVFHTASLVYPLDDEPPVLTTFSSCLRPQACWAPAEAARLIVMHPDGNSMQLVVSTYELRAKKSKQEVEIVDSVKPPNLMRSHGSQVLLLVSGLQLVLFSIHGLQLAAFQDHQRPITSVWVHEYRRHRSQKRWNECSEVILLQSGAWLRGLHHIQDIFTLAACAEGNLYALMLPQLQLVSRVTAFPNVPVQLLSSPDCQWVFASSQNSDLEPKVFHTASLVYPLDDEPPVLTTFSSCLRPQACWAPAEAARLIVMHPDGNSMQLVVSTYELRAKKSKQEVEIVVQQIASFLLPDSVKPPNLMRSHGSQVLLLVSGLQLVLFSIHGLQLAAFQDHQRPITSVWVDPSRVITSSLDLSLRVYVWKKENKFPVLKSCYHLLGGSHRWASGYMHVESDSMSIVGIEARSVGTSVLRSFCFKVERG